MVRKFGVSMDEELAEWIEESLEYGDKRSERIAELCVEGKALETVLAEYGLEAPDSEVEIRSMLRTFLAAAERDDSVDL